MTTSNDHRPIRAADWPAAEELMPVQTICAPHPALLSLADLMKEVEIRFQRRGGPGGQHRNKVSTGAFLTHRPTTAIGESTESRSQRTNRSIAAERLRLTLAIGFRTSRLQNAGIVAGDSPANGIEQMVRKRASDRRLKISLSNVDYAAVLALLLDDLHVAGGQPSLLVESWRTNTSGILRFLGRHPAAFAFVNQIRAHHQRKVLK